jgi:hypothetical protein
MGSGSGERLHLPARGLGRTERAMVKEGWENEGTSWVLLVRARPSCWRGGRSMETTTNTRLVNPAALIAALADPRGEAGLWQKLRVRVGEEVRYHQALREPRRLDDRDLDDLNLGRGDLPGLSRAYARATATSIK